MNDKPQLARLTLLTLGVLALILVPFALCGPALDSWTAAFLRTAGEHRPAAAAVLGGLLASDILLPVPSSVVSTACGWVLGLPFGAAVSLAGMTASCAAGFALARRVGQPAVARFMGAADMERVAGLSRRCGDWMIILARPVPVLAEASVLFAGLGDMRAARFLALSTLSNLGISLTYAAAGALSANRNAFLPALAVSILLPWLVLLAAKRYAGLKSARRNATSQEEAKNGHY